MSKIKFAIIGCGRIGNRHANHINNFGELVAVCDIDEKKAVELSKTFSCNYYLNLTDMLKNESTIDVVSICSPNGLHYEHSIESLNYNNNVLCEKPLALSAFHCAEMIKLAEKKNLRLFAIKQNRFNPPVMAVKHAIEEGRFGKIFNVQLSCFWNRNENYYKNSWKGSLDLDGGTLYTQFSHFIDLLYWLIGDIKDFEIYANNFMHNGVIEFEDTGVLIIKFYNEAIGTINYTVNSTNKNMEGSLTIFGENGTVKIGGQYLNELEYQQFDNYSIKNIENSNKANDYGDYQGSMSNHDLVYQNLVEVLQNNAPIKASAIEAMKSVEIIEKIYNKLRK